jgi:hypothetical protein
MQRRTRQVLCPPVAFVLRKGENILSPRTRIRLTGPPNEVEAAVLFSSMIAGAVVALPDFNPTALVAVLGNGLSLYMWCFLMSVGSLVALIGLWQPFTDPTRGANLKSVGLMAVSFAFMAYSMCVIVYNFEGGIVVIIWTAWLSLAFLRRAVVVRRAVRSLLRESGNATAG